MRRFIIIALVVVAIGTALYYGYKWYKKSQEKKNGNITTNSGGDTVQMTQEEFDAMVANMQTPLDEPLEAVVQTL